MNSAFTFFKSMPITLVLAVLTGLFFSPIINHCTSEFYQQYDKANPPVLLTATLQSEPYENEILFALTGEKLRSECRFIRLAAFTRQKHTPSIFTEAFIQRVDMPETNASRPVGKQSFGIWKVWPRNEAIRLIIFTHHECSKRIVIAEVVNIEL